LIGRYPSETLRDGNHFNTYLPNNVFVAERVQTAGIQTLGVSSLWYFAPWSGLSQGFDVWDMSAKPPGGGATDNTITGDKVSDAAINVLRGKGSARFFMWVHYLDPHAEYLPHPGAPDFSVPGDKRASGEVRARYDGEVWYTDQQVGRLLDYVFSQEWGKRTAVILTADHGEAFGDHAMSYHGREIWESVVRVPLVVHYPQASAKRVSARRSHIDLAPTMLAMLNLAPVTELPGESLLPDVIENGTPATRSTYIDMPLGPFNGLRRALIRGEGAGMKLLHFGANQYQLYDLDADPNEGNDLTKSKEALAPMVDAYNQKRATTHEIEVKPVP
jgi:choline-sulfatase